MAPAETTPMRSCSTLSIDPLRQSLQLALTSVMILISSPALSATFGAPIDRELTASSPTGSVSADFNEDGFQDMAFAMSGQAGGDGGLTVVLSDGAGGFGDNQSVDVASFAATAVTAADFNGDGDIDLAAVGQGAGFQGRLQVFLGDGTGDFTTPPQFAWMVLNRCGLFEFSAQRRQPDTIWL